MRNVLKKKEVVFQHDICAERLNDFKPEYQLCSVSQAHGGVKTVASDSREPYVAYDLAERKVVPAIHKGGGVVVYIKGDKKWYVETYEETNIWKHTEWILMKLRDEMGDRYQHEAFHSWRIPMQDPEPSSTTTSTTTPHEELR